MENKLTLLCCDVQLLDEIHARGHPAVDDREGTAEKQMVCTADFDCTLDLGLAPGSRMRHIIVDVVRKIALDAVSLCRIETSQYLILFRLMRCRELLACEPVAAEHRMDEFQVRELFEHAAEKLTAKGRRLIDHTPELAAQVRILQEGATHHAVDHLRVQIAHAAPAHAEMVGRAYGGGILKIEPREADVWEVPSPALIEEHARKLRSAKSDVAGLLRSGKLLEAVRIIDQILLVDSGWVSSEQIEHIRQARTELAHRRTVRAASGR